MGDKGTFFADVTGDGKADAIVVNVVNNQGVTVRRSDGNKFLPNERWTDIGYMGSGGHGSLVKGSGNPVYLIQGNLRRHVPDPETFNFMGINWGDVQSISDDHLNGIGLGVSLPSRKNGALVHGSDGKVYLMENGQRRHIPNPETFNAMGLNWGAIQYVSDSDLNAIPLGNPLPSQKVNERPSYTYKESDYLNALYQDTVSNRVSSDYDYAHKNFYAIDSADGDADRNLYALVGGEVIEAKNGKEVNSKYWGYNGTVAIYNKELDKTFIYWHLAEGSINESLKGKTIASGDPIGKEGNTGASYGAHTHVEVHNGRAYVNMSNPSAPKSPANSGRLYIPNVFQDAVRKGLVKLYQ
ncbi:MAG: M23 family metallopeptidase [Oscillatoriales cyanobacterium RU_3_3]|nr:M23 family metallopeptidase [Oscillatoriales cyanobacterium RU_3_3]